MNTSGIGSLVLIEGNQVRTHRCDDGFPGVVVADVLAPFGKRVDTARGLWEGWARVRTERLAHTSRTGVRDSSSETTLMHVEDIPLLIARLDRRGMDDEIKALHTRFLIVCRNVLAAHFFPKVEPIDVAAIVAAATKSAVDAVMPMFTQLLAAEREAREETRLVVGTRRARGLLDRIGSIACIHAQRGSKAWRKTHRRVSNDVRDRLKLGVSGAWAALPERHLADIDAALERIEKTERERVPDQRDLAVVLDLHPKKGA